MASLRAFLPPAGSTVWRNERRATRTSSNGEVEYSLSRTRIKHIVIREVWKKTVPSLHALYKIDVMTQSNHWFILRRYREFYTLHQNLVKHYGIPIDMLPSKKLSSNMSLIHLDRRRNALEHYLQRLINSHHDIAESNELFQFLNVQTHDVLCVTRQLAKILEKEGRNVLANGGMFTFTPTQMYCITRQLQLPHFVVEEPAEDEEFADLGYLYGFIQELKSLCVSGLPSRSSPCQEFISNQAFDISLFKSLEKLQIDNCHISVIEGLFRIQKQLTHVTLRNSLKTMKQFIVDCATQKRTVNQANNSVEPWRNYSTTKLTENRVVVRPWIHLTHVNMSHNKISALDHSLKLLPALEQLDLSHNEFVHLDLKQLTSSTLTFLNISHNNIHYISATAKDLRNLKSLLVSHNRLQCLDGLDGLRGLVELDIRHNEIKITEELVKISSLLHLRILALTGNPCVASKSYRIHVFIQLKTRELILDGVKISENEKAKVHEHQERKAKDLGIQSPEASVSTAQQPSSLAMRRKIIKSDRDDDQDSGFGGNYGGSIDEGGLVFDWCCYGNYTEMTTTAEDVQGAGPSTSWHDLTSSTEQNNDILVSNSHVSRSNILGNLPLKEGWTGKGKAPLRVKRLEHSETVSPKRSTSKGRQRQPNVVADEMQGMHRDFQGTVVAAEDVLYEGNDAVCNKLQSESSDSKESCGKESGHLFIGEIPFGPHTEASERSNVGSLPSLTVVGESSLDVVVDVSTRSSVLIETSPPSTVYDINSESSKITEEPLSDEVGYTSQNSSFCEQSYHATVLQEEAKCSPPEKLSVGTGCETDKKSDSVTTEPLSHKLKDVHLVPPCEELSPAAGCVSKTSCSNNAEPFSHKLDVRPSSPDEEYSSVSGDTNGKSSSISGEPLLHVVKDVHPCSPNEEPYFSISGNTDKKSCSVSGEPLLHVVKDIEPTKESSLSAGCDINHTSCLNPGGYFSNILKDVQHISSDDESSPDKQLSSVPVCEDEDETCSFSTENLFASVPDTDANYCSIAQESSDVLNDILKISSLLDKHSLPNPGSDDRTILSIVGNSSGTDVGNSSETDVRDANTKPLSNEDDTDNSNSCSAQDNFLPETVKDTSGLFVGKPSLATT